MATECIHGLEEGLCGICFPRRAPEPSPRSSRVVTPRQRTPRERAPRAAQPAEKPLNLAEQRVFHLTHIRNLESILDTGGLLADVRSSVDLSSELTRELRRTAELADGSSVADHVPFFLSPTPALWDDVRRGVPDPRFTPAAIAADAYDFLFLGSTFGTLPELAIMSDGDAAATFTRFATSAEDKGRMLRRLRNDDDAMRTAEVLVPETVPFDSITMVGVANDKVRDVVRTILARSDCTPRVVVYPPWFQPPV